MNILVSAPSMYQGLPFLPYIYALLRAKCDTYPQLKEKLNWLSPIYLTGFDIEEVLQPYKEQAIDVLALSCYEWNWEFQKSLAAKVKQDHPRCQIVLGGPQPDWKNFDFFSQYPWADFVVRGEGETPFAELLSQVIQEGPVEAKGIPGLWSRFDFETYNPKDVHKEVVEETLPSIYLQYAQEMKAIAKEVNDNPRSSDIWVNWETSRGCPYSCTFCDWGSATFSKIRQFSMSRLKAELDFFGECKVDTIYITDANFGIQERDLEITQMLIEANKQYGFPNTVFFNAAKNNPKRLKTILHELSDAGLLKYCIQNNLQSTQADVLAEMKRINMKESKQRDFIQEVLDVKIPLGSALIMGNPGEDRESFRRSLFDSMEWGMHSEIRVFNWALLPNAPAAEPSYIKKHEISTVVRPTIRNAVHRSISHHPFLGKSEYLVSHKMLSREDWLDNSVYVAFVLALHNLALTKFIAIFLRLNREISYADFYANIYDRFLQFRPEWIREVRSTFENFLNENDAIVNMSFDKSKDLLIDAEAWLFCHIVDEIDSFYSFIRRSLSEQIGGVDEEVDDLITYNKEVLITPDYDSEAGKVFETKFDWMGYFDRALVCARPTSLYLEKLESCRHSISNKMTGPNFDIPLNFSHQNEEQRWSQYIHSVAGYKSSRHMRSYFHGYDCEKA